MVWRKKNPSRGGVDRDMATSPYRQRIMLDLPPDVKKQGKQTAKHIVTTIAIVAALFAPAFGVHVSMVFCLIVMLLQDRRS